MSELKGKKKMKVIALYEQTPKQFLHSTPTPKVGQNVKTDPNIKSKSNARVEGNIENESCSTT